VPNRHRRLADIVHDLLIRLHRRGSGVDLAVVGANGAVAACRGGGEPLEDLAEVLERVGGDCLVLRVGVVPEIDLGRVREAAGADRDRSPGQGRDQAGGEADVGGVVLVSAVVRGGDVRVVVCLVVVLDVCLVGTLRGQGGGVDGCEDVGGDLLEAVGETDGSGEGALRLLVFLFGLLEFGKVVVEGGGGD
jgi:hypothetical protein